MSDLSVGKKVVKSTHSSIVEICFLNTLNCMNSEYQKNIQLLRSWTLLLMTEPRMAMRGY